MGLEYVSTLIIMDPINLSHGLVNLSPYIGCSAGSEDVEAGICFSDSIFKRLGLWLKHPF